jgi:nucleolar protein 12
MEPLKRNAIRDHNDPPNSALAEIADGHHPNEPFPEVVADIDVTHPVKKEKTNKKRKRMEQEEEAKTDDIESRYITKIYSKISKKQKSTDDQSPKESPPLENPDDEIDPALLQHEALTPTSLAAEKTIFISNLPVKVLTSKPHLRSLKKLFSQHGKISSLRFRSIAFTNLGSRKVAFITKNLHPERDTLNAYIVFASADSVASAVQSLNGFEWEEKHLRVDSVSNPTVFAAFFQLIEGP